MSLQEKPTIQRYVGITGVQSPEDVNMTLDVGAASGFGPGQSHNVMLGALVSPATIRNGEPENTAKGYRHVAGMEELIATLGAATQAGAVAMVHMELHKELWGTEGDGQHVITLLQALEPHDIRPAVQLNGILRPDDIKRISEETGAPIVLQFRKELEQANPAEVIRYVAEVQGAISEVLLDPSMGTGAVFDPETGLEWHRRLTEAFPDQFSYGVAGGLGGLSQESRTQTTEIVYGVAAALGGVDFSLDIESQAREPVGDGPEDRLARVRLEAYLQSARLGFDKWSD